MKARPYRRSLALALSCNLGYTGRSNARRAWMQAPLRLVIFDCDGVLVDSEALCDRIVSQALHEAGWPISPAECHRRFVGLTFADTQTAAELHLDRPLGADWIARIAARVTAVMAAEVEPIPGARQALEATSALDLPWRIASNSSRPEMAAKFGRVGFADLVGGRIHSAYDLIPEGLPGKPAPHLFLRAAAAEAVPPASCVVIEDSLAGVRAAISAGMACLALSPDGPGEALRQAGAHPFASMQELPNLLRAMRDRQP
jgi:HAD superfamily hydrolase (TIGR01509 family)